MTANAPPEKIQSSERIAILGSSRGLGWAVYQQLVLQANSINFFLSSRKILSRSNEVTSSTKLVVEDFSRLPCSSGFLSQLQSFSPTRIIYVAGGGPYGAFSTKKWSDHQWALNTTFLFPAELLHTILSQTEAWPKLRQVTFVGSQVAEASPDPNAASYAAAKHALKGLIATIQVEMTEQNRVALPEVLLFSPSYMQTDMLPANSWPVESGLAADPAVVARELIKFIEKNNQR